MIYLGDIYTLFVYKVNNTSYPKKVALLSKPLSKANLFVNISVDKSIQNLINNVRLMYHQWRVNYEQSYD